MTHLPNIDRCLVEGKIAIKLEEFLQQFGCARKNSNNRKINSINFNVINDQYKFNALQKCITEMSHLSKGEKIKPLIMKTIVCTHLMCLCSSAV